MATILLVDDEKPLLSLLQDALSAHDVLWAADGIGALHQLAAIKPDLILLDLRLPGMDGSILLSRIRAISTVPVIILSARHEQADVVLSLKAGADDFVAKPFDIDELEARIDAVLLRSSREPEFAERLTITDADGVRLDGREVRMSYHQRRLLILLARERDKVVSVEQIAAEMWPGEPGHVADVRQTVQRLRRRLDSAGGPPIINVPYHGYLLGKLDS